MNLGGLTWIKNTYEFVKALSTISEFTLLFLYLKFSDLLILNKLDIL